MNIDIDIIFIEDIVNKKCISTIDISGSTNIVIYQGKINEQDILFEEIQNENLDLREKNYLTLQRYFDCKKVSKQEDKLQPHTCYPIVYISPKIAMKKNMQMYLYYQDFYKYKKASKACNHHLRDSLYKLYIQFHVKPKSYRMKMNPTKKKNYYIYIVPFFTNASVDEINDKEGFKKYINELVKKIENETEDDMVFGSSKEGFVKDINLHFFDSEKSKTKNKKNNENKSNDLSKFVFNLMLDEKNSMPSFTTLNINDKLDENVALNREASLLANTLNDKLGENETLDREASLLANTLNDTINENAALNKEASLFANTLNNQKDEKNTSFDISNFEKIFLSPIDKNIDNFINRILDHIDFYIEIKKSKKEIKLGDKNIFKKYQEINKILDVIKEEESKSFNFEENPEGMGKCISKYNQYKELIANLVKFNKSNDKTEEIKEDVQNINNYYYSFIQKHGDFYFKFGKFIKKYVKSNENINFDITMIEKCFEISGYATNNSEAFRQLAKIYGPSIKKWKCKLNKKHFFIDQEKYRLYLSLSAYLRNQKAIKEFARLCINEKKYSYAFYMLNFFDSKEDLEHYLIKASALETINLEESVYIYLQIAKIDINKLKEDDENRYAILLARIQFFRLLFKPIEYIGQLQTTSSDIDVSFKKLISLINKILYDNSLSPSISTLEFLLTVFSDCKQMLEDFTPQNTTESKIKSKKLKAQLTEMSCEAEKILCDIELIQLYADKNYEYDNSKKTIVSRLRNLFENHNYFPASTRLAQLYFEIYSFKNKKYIFDPLLEPTLKERIKINNKCINSIASEEEIEEILKEKTNSFVCQAVNNDCFHDIYQLKELSLYDNQFFKSISQKDKDFIIENQKKKKNEILFEYLNTDFVF